MNRNCVVGLGELLWDCFSDGQRRPGGAPANVAFHAAQWGRPAAVCSQVGDDPLGAELRQFLIDQGLSADHVAVDPEHPTGVVTVDLSPTGHQFTIHEGAAWDFLQASPENLALLSQASAVCFGSLAQRGPTSRASIAQLLDAVPSGCLRVFDVNLRQQFYTSEVLHASLGRADVLKVNQEEVSILGPLLDLPTDFPSFAGALRLRYPIRWVVVTLGAAGCWASSPSETLTVPGVPAVVVDTVGSGDSFTATFLHGLLSCYPLSLTCLLSNSYASLVSSHPGAMPVLSSHIPSLLSKFGLPS